MRWSERPTAARSRFGWLGPLHCGPGALPVAVAHLGLVRRRYAPPQKTAKSAHVEIILIIAAIILVLLIWGFVEHAAVEVGRSSEKQAWRPRYKRRWQVVGILLAAGLVISAYCYVSYTAALVTIGVLLVGYFIVFRYLLERSSAMQRCFLKDHVSPNASTSDNRNT